MTIFNTLEHPHNQPTSETMLRIPAHEVFCSGRIVSVACPNRFVVHEGIGGMISCHFATSYYQFRGLSNFSAPFALEFASRAG